MRWHRPYFDEESLMRFRSPLITRGLVYLLEILVLGPLSIERISLITRWSLLSFKTLNSNVRPSVWSLNLVLALSDFDLFSIIVISESIWRLRVLSDREVADNPMSGAHKRVRKKKFAFNRVQSRAVRRIQWLAAVKWHSVCHSENSEESKLRRRQIKKKAN